MCQLQFLFHSTEEKQRLKSNGNEKEKILEPDENILMFFQIKYYRLNRQLVQNTSNRKVKSFSRLGRLQMNIQIDLAFFTPTCTKASYNSFPSPHHQSPGASGKSLHPTSMFVSLPDNKSCFTFLQNYSRIFKITFLPVIQSVFPTSGLNSHSSSFPLTFLLLKFRGLTFYIFQIFQLPLSASYICPEFFMPQVLPMS